MNPSHARRPRRARDIHRPGVELLAVLVLAALAAAAAGCGSSSSSTPAAAATATAIQVMATATRGDLTQSATGSAKLTKAGDKPVAIATIDAQNASSVVQGQTATVTFMRGGGSFPQSGQSGMPQPQGSGMPAPQGSGLPQGAPSGMPQGGSNGAPFPQGGQGGRGGTAGTVTAVQTNADGTAAVTISLDELPSGAKVGSTGFGSIEVKVLASDVILIPTAAVKGSGDSATVEVSANGKTETRTIAVGQQSGGMTEVVSGLDEGENVLYTQAFRGSPGGGQGGMSGAPFPQGGQSGGGS